MSPEIGSTPLSGPTPTGNRYGITDSSARRQAAENVRNAQSQKQQKNQETRQARTDLANAQAELQTARAEEQRAGQRVQDARNQQQAILRAGGKIDVVA